MVFVTSLETQKPRKNEDNLDRIYRIYRINTLERQTAASTPEVFLKPVNPVEVFHGPEKIHDSQNRYAR